MYPAAPNGGANFASYESDMMLTTGGYLLPEFQIRTGDNKLIFTFYIEVRDGKVNLLASDKSLIAELASDGEWFKFGVKATDYEGKLLITFYLNGERIKTGFKYTASGAANTVGRLRFWTETSHTGFIYFDNTKVLSATGELETIDPGEVETPTPEPDPEPDPDPTPDPEPDPDPIVPPEPITPPDPSTDGPFGDDEDVAGKDWT